MKKHGENLSEKRNGDDNMLTGKTIYPALDINSLLKQAQQISSKDALKEISPIEWSEDVLNGKYKGKSIIKAKDDEGNENV